MGGPHGDPPMGIHIGYPSAVKKMKTKTNKARKSAAAESVARRCVQTFLFLDKVLFENTCFLDNAVFVNESKVFLDNGATMQEHPRCGCAQPNTQKRSG